MKQFKIIIALLFLIYTGCERAEIEQAGVSKIEFGKVCGWCAGDEFLRITPSKIEYERNIPCGEGKGTKKRSINISPAEWEKLSSSFSFSEFKKLEYNTCNVCADGCDEIIRITTNGITHEIRYSPEDKIHATENLKQLLLGLLEEIKTQD